MFICTYVYVGDCKKHLFLFSFGYSPHLQIIKTSEFNYYMVTDTWSERIKGEVVIQYLQHREMAHGCWGD